eukprot:728124-Pelagomonas_calceolata.AAC.2
MTLLPVGCLQLATMLAIGMGIATYMQRKVNARKKQLELKAEEADEEGVELTPMHRSVLLFVCAYVSSSAMDVCEMVCKQYCVLLTLHECALSVEEEVGIRFGGNQCRSP